MKNTKKSLLKLLDFSKEEILDFINYGIELKGDLKSGKKNNALAGKTIALIFEKNSTRTRVSFETGVAQLGGYPLYLSGNELQLGRGESVKDTARVLSRYVDGIMIRTFSQDRIAELAKYASVPVINGLSDEYHPCQILADIMTVKEYKKKLEGLKVAFIGDGNNVANSYIVGALKLGMKFSIARPEGYGPLREVLEFAKGNPDLKLTTSPEEAAYGADVVLTDVYVSMGMEGEKTERMKLFEGFTVDEKLMSLAAPDAIVQHCLPAHKGEEISEETFEKHAAEIFDEAENRLHVQKAVMARLF
jgi:ornithine carbamoyltransferase